MHGSLPKTLPWDETMEVDLLIGWDFYWEFVTGKTIWGENGPIAINTNLGLVVSRPTGVAKQEESTVSLVGRRDYQIKSLQHFEVILGIRIPWNRRSSQWPCMCVIDLLGEGWKIWGIYLVLQADLCWTPAHNCWIVPTFVHLYGWYQIIVLAADLCLFIIYCPRHVLL